MYPQQQIKKSARGKLYNNTMMSTREKAYIAIGRHRHEKRRDARSANRLLCIQWLLERQKEQCRQREREVAEAREKERQAGVRLRATEAFLKKKTEEHRQLAHESQLNYKQVCLSIFSRIPRYNMLHVPYANALFA